MAASEAVPTPALGVVDLVFKDVLVAHHRITAIHLDDGLIRLWLGIGHHIAPQAGYPNVAAAHG